MRTGRSIPRQEARVIWCRIWPADRGLASQLYSEGIRTMGYDPVGALDMFIKVRNLTSSGDWLHRHAEMQLAKWAAPR